MSFWPETGHRPSEMANPPAPQTELAQAAHIEIGQGSNYHKFSFPIVKTWGNQRVLRCVSVTGKCENRAREAGSGDSGEEEEVREKLLVHLREAADRIKVIVQQPQLLPPSKGDERRIEAVREPEGETGPSSSPVAWPWKLRTRRSGSRVAAVFERQACASPLEVAEKRAPRLRPAGGIERSVRSNFSIELTREEIDEDIYAVTGFRARRRPRKRPRVVQKQLDVSTYSYKSG